MSSTWAKRFALVFALFGLGATSGLMAGLPFWLDPPKRGNPNDPLSGLKPANTPTPVPTLTKSPTITMTSTFTSTTTPNIGLMTTSATPTPTFSNSPVFTSTPTTSPTMGICGMGCANFWNFEDGTTQGWYLGDELTQAATAAQPGATAHCGTGSLALPFAATTARNVVDCMNLDFSPVIDLSGKAATCWVYIAAPAPASGTLAVQICAWDGGTLKCAGWTDGLPVNTWTKITQTFGPGTTNVVHLDLQVVWNNPGAAQTWNGTVYVDEICTAASVASPTPTASPSTCGAGCIQYWGFNDATTDGWDIIAGGFAQAGTGASASPAMAKCGGYSLAMPFTATTANNKVECHQIVAFDPVEDFSNMQVSLWLYVDAPAPSAGTIAMQICTQSASFNCAGWTDGLPVNTWVKVTQAFGASNAGVNNLDLQVIWNNPGAAWSGTVYIDEICVAPPAPAATATPTASPVPPASTLTSTPTPGTCGNGCTQYWGFDDGTTQGWHLGDEVTQAATGMQQSGAIAHCGAGSLALPFAATTARNAIDCMNPNFAPTVDLSGSAVTCWVYIAAPAPPSGTVAVQICAQGSTFSCAGWTDNLPVNTWTQVIQTFAAGTTNVVHLNVQVVWNNPGASQTWNGTVNLDDICVK